ncbi:hypothetical protein ACQVPJ_22175 [Bacillus mycoides]|nr:MULTISPECIES: hypothetical protein [Bacillus cereus group]MCQ6568875.1 hypothetical protein [Bacillus mycoides]
MSNSLSNSNINQLQENSYPGRGIIIGLSPNSKNIFKFIGLWGGVIIAEIEFFSMNQDLLELMHMTSINLKIRH